MLDSDTNGAQAIEEKPRILVADDSKIVRVTAKRMLAEKFEVVFAEDGEEAWSKLCEDDSIQVLFSDLGMPNLDGYGLIERIRESDDPRIREQAVIVITGAAEDEGVKRKALEVGATDFITKPFKATEIIARAESHVSYRRDKVNLEKNLDVDLLTGTLNKNGLNEQLERDVSFVNRHNENLAVITFELDNFQSILDKIQQPAAEQIIKHVANTLVSAIRKEDSIGRIDLSKFVAVLPMAKQDGVIMLARRLCEKIKTFNFKVAGEVVSLTMSVGIATASKGMQVKAADLLNVSNEALANAKSLGFGEVQILKCDNSQSEGIAKTPKSDQEHDESSHPEVVSIDASLKAIAEGKSSLSEKQLTIAAAHLQPLVALMSDPQRLKLLGKI